MREKILLPKALLNKVEKKIASGVESSSESIRCQVPPPKIIYDVNSTVAGWATFEHWSIRLNPTLLYYAPDRFIEEIPLHELGHLIADALETPKIKRQKQGDHGEHRQSVVETIGGVAKPHHEFDVSMFTKSPFVYKCKQCGMTHKFGYKRHNAAQQGAQYACTPGCKSELCYSHKAKPRKKKCVVDIGC